MYIIKELVCAFLLGFTAGINGFFSAYNAISGVQDQIIALVLGVPVGLIAVVGIAKIIVKLAAKFL